MVGTRGTLRSVGPDLGHQTVTLWTEAGVAQPELSGQWFNDGFAGAMGALLVAVETGQPPLNSARGNLVRSALPSRRWSARGRDECAVAVSLGLHIQRPPA